MVLSLVSCFQKWEQTCPQSIRVLQSPAIGSVDRVTNLHEIDAMLHAAILVAEFMISRSFGLNDKEARSYLSADKSDHLDVRNGEGIHYLRRTLHCPAPYSRP